ASRRRIGIFGHRENAGLKFSGALAALVVADGFCRLVVGRMLEDLSRRQRAALPPARLASRSRPAAAWVGKAVPVPACCVRQMPGEGAIATTPLAWDAPAIIVATDEGDSCKICLHELVEGRFRPTRLSPRKPARSADQGYPRPDRR